MKKNQSETSQSGITLIRGAFFDFLDDPWKYIGRENESARYIRDGLLVVEGGIIKDFGAFDELSPKYPDQPVTHIQNRIIMPGFIDGHIHFPQVRVLGAYGKQLLDWLQIWIFPEEIKYANRDYAGRGMRTIAGLTGIDRFAPPDYVITPEDFYRESKRLIETYHRKGRHLYAITPRFAVGCTDEMMEACAKLKKEFPDCWINTHISENPTEVRQAKQEFPDCPDYTAVHEKHGLLGPKFTAGHGVWLSNDEFRRFAKAGAGVCFCPLSNLFLGSGLFRIGRALDPDHRVRLSLGCDMGGGNAFSIIRVLEEAYKVGMCNNTMLDGSVNEREHDAAEAERNKLNPYRAFYLATLGGAQALYIDDMLGNFNVGKEADFVALDWNAGQLALEWHQSLVTTEPAPANIDQAAMLLFGIMACGDDRNVDETWISGKRAYKKA